jgi:hypothetical protein
MTPDAGARRLDGPSADPRTSSASGSRTGERTMTVTARPPEFVTPKVTEIIIRPKPEAAR